MLPTCLGPSSISLWGLATYPAPDQELLHCGESVQLAVVSQQSCQRCRSSSEFEGVNSWEKTDVRILDIFLRFAEWVQSIKQHFFLGWRDGSVGKGVWCHTRWPEFYSGIPQCGRSELIPESCPLTLTHELWQEHTCTHAYKMNKIQLIKSLSKGPLCACGFTKHIGM